MLTAGTRLGVYEITAQIGEGGMGQAYRATDTKLKRQVAIKVLPAALAGDAERLARFQREAEVLASLNHPNIAIIHGLESEERLRPHRAEDKEIRGEDVGPFLVMELVEGDDLSVAAPGAAGGALFVQPFPATGATYPISKGYGIHAFWSPDGRELFYGPGPGRLAAVSVTTRPAFTFGNPVSITRMFTERGPAFERPNDFTLDGKRFLAVVPAGQSGAISSPGSPGSASATGSPAAPQIQVVLNWFEELKARVPAK